MCLDDQILNTYLDNELTEPWKDQVEEHLGYCQSCRIRYQKLLKISDAVKSSELTDAEIQPHKDRVLSMIEKNYLANGKGKKSFLRRTFRLSASQMIGVAAAFVVVFVGSWAVIGNRSSSGSSIILEDGTTTIGMDKITLTRYSDNSSTSKSLDEYTLDEIIKHLDARGYDVNISVKSIQPLLLDRFETGVTEIARIEKDDITITSDGLAKDAGGTIVASGVKLVDNAIVASDGTVLWTADETTVMESN